MKDLQLLALECMEELDNIGIEYGTVKEFTVNTRAKSRWGQCCKRDSVYYINISSRLLDDYVSDKATKTTIIHELLHTCKGCMNHGREWQKLADLVNDCYMYNVKRCTSDEEKGIKHIEKEIEYKYIFKCQGCGQIIKRTKMSKFVKYYDLYSCGICKNKFETIKWEDEQLLSCADSIK